MAEDTLEIQLDKVLWKTGLPHAIYAGECICEGNACGCAKDYIARFENCYPSATYDNLIGYAANKKDANLCAAILNRLSELINGKKGKYQAIQIMQRTLFADVWQIYPK